MNGLNNFVTGMIGIDVNGNVGAGTSTNGASFKIPGYVSLSTIREIINMSYHFTKMFLKYDHKSVKFCENKKSKYLGELEIPLYLELGHTLTHRSEQQQLQVNRSTSSSSYR